MTIPVTGKYCEKVDNSTKADKLIVEEPTSESQSSKHKKLQNPIIR